MRANELMVGDWLQHASGKYFQITRLDMCGDGSVHFACGHPHLWEYNNKFTPIPLTAEILEKNGWRKPQMDYDKEMRCEFLTCDGDWILWINGDSFMFTRKEDFVGHGIELKYVHELQHALRLCGIEKEIDL